MKSLRISIISHVVGLMVLLLLLLAALAMSDAGVRSALAANASVAASSTDLNGGTGGGSGGGAPPIIESPVSGNWFALEETFTVNGLARPGTVVELFTSQSGLKLDTLVATTTANGLGNWRIQTKFTRPTYLIACTRDIFGQLIGYPPANITRAQMAWFICDYLDLTLIDTPTPSFTDMSVGHWAYRYVETARESGVMGGYFDGTFRPDNSVMRAEFAKTVVVGLKLDIDTTGTPFSDSFTNWASDYIMTAKNNGLVLGNPDNSFKPSLMLAHATYLDVKPVPPTSGGGGGGRALPAEVETTPTIKRFADTVFSDVPSNAWFKEFVSSLISLDIIGGYPDGTFKPVKPVTRAEFAKMVCLAMSWELQDPAIPSFKDVAKTNWAYKYIETAKANGALGGYSDGTISPGNNITRAEMAKIVAGCLKLAPGTNTFKDVQEHWARRHVDSCALANILNGYTDNMFRPDYSATRAEASKIIAGMVEHK